MPIKFHCQHCEQLLGIARSRAGAIVDCPQCGRSLRVPELDGRTRRMPKPVSSVTSDSGLISALSELSALGDPAASPITANEQTNAAVQAPPRAMVERVDVIPVPLETVNTTETSKPNVDEGPFAFSESLQELASLTAPESNRPVSDDLLTEMQQVSHPSTSPLLGMFGGVLLLLLGIAGGWWMGRSTTPVNQALGGDKQSVVAGKAIMDADEPHRKNAENIISGNVKYVETTGTFEPDTGALVVLLPSEHDGDFRLHAKAFRKPPGDLDRLATLAALEAVGGVVAVVDDSGNFQLSTDGKDGCVLVVVSRHRTRPTDVPIPESAATILEKWFDSTSHICGKLAVQVVDVDNAEADLKLRF